MWPEAKLAVRFGEEVIFGHLKSLVGRNTLLFSLFDIVVSVWCLELLQPTYREGLRHFGCAKGSRVESERALGSLISITERLNTSPLAPLSVCKPLGVASSVISSWKYSRTYCSDNSLCDSEPIVFPKAAVTRSFSRAVLPCSSLTQRWSLIRPPWIWAGLRALLLGIESDAA